MTARKGKRRVWIKLLAGLAVAAGAVAFVAWYKLFREEPQHFDSMAERFKYGSIGVEANEGLPYWVWLVLPRVFPNYLSGPGGYESLGLVWEEGHETPVGFSKKTIGFPRVAINCAACHAGTYRTRPDQSPTVVAGAPATRLNPLAYQRFLFQCASDPRFTADTLLREIEYNIKLSPLDKFLYRWIIIPQTRKALLQQKEQFAWTEMRPDWGPGRIDPFNPVKFHLLGMDPAGDGSIGNSDMEPIWDQARKTGYALHWDGLNDSLREVVLSGALGDGATPKTLPLADLQELQDWLMKLQPPKYPYPIDWQLAAQGKPVYQQLCAACHASGGQRTGQVIPESEVQTDPHRLGMWSQEAADRYNNYAAKYPWRFSHFQKHDGYVAVSLEGLWLRAPYLHNGSVPTLEDLLEPSTPPATPAAAPGTKPLQRPPVFYRGYDVYEPQGTGFIHAGAAAERAGFKYDTSVPGNGNRGHEGKDYGTALPPEQKRALVEYLKTL